MACKRAICGTLSVAILAGEKLAGHHTEEWRFEMNPREPCMWNKQVNGDQSLLCSMWTMEQSVTKTQLSWHISSGDGRGKTNPVAAIRGDKHGCIGMSADFPEPGEVEMAVCDCVEKLINKLPEDAIGENWAAAPECLPPADSSEARLLGKEQKDMFHTLTAIILCLSQREDDLQLAVVFLCTGVKSPGEHNWKKPGCPTGRLQATAWMTLKSITKERDHTFTWMVHMLFIWM